MHSSVKHNEHPACGCRSCRRGAGTPGGQFTHRAVNRRLRHAYRTQLRVFLFGAVEDDYVEVILLSTPYTD